MPPSRNTAAEKISRALWQLYRRPDRPMPWATGGNLPWNDPAFSERMLREHLDQSHGAASRTEEERAAQLPWLQQKLQLAAGDHLLDVTCGPGLYAVPLAQQGINVTGIDFAPAAVRHARQLADAAGVSDLCQIIEADVHEYSFPAQKFDAAMILYGQLAVMSREDAVKLIQNVGQALKPGGVILLELLNPDQVDKSDSSWWFTDHQGLWGDGPFLCLGERQWRREERLSLERYYVVHLESGQFDEITLCDQMYSAAEVGELLNQANFQSPKRFNAWDELSLKDRNEWLIYTSAKTY